MRYIYLVGLLFSIVGYSQNSWDDLTGKEKAFLYHQSRKVELLNPTLFHLFEFTDSIPYINDTLPDYRYIERTIVQRPSVLKLHRGEFDRKSDGLISDLALRFALWELDQILQYRNSTAEEDKPLKERLKVFEKLVLEEAPQSAIRTLNNGDYVLAKTLQGYYAPSLTVGDKMAAIINAGYTQIDQMLILNAIMAAEEKFVANRTKEIYELLGGDPESNENYLSAVGDGRNWSEIKGGFNTPYTMGLPDEKGLFRFIIEERFDEEQEKDIVAVKDIEVKTLNLDPVQETVIHVDVFGYHPERQTTVAVQKGGNSYVLYGKNEHRLVSPDSTYGEGTTYWRLMNRLEHYHIANLKEDLYGKKGYEYQIDLFEKKIEKTKLQIKETEYRLDKLRHTPEGKPKMKKKKLKKKDLGRSDQVVTGHLTSAMSKLDKKKNIEQNRLLQLNGLLDGQKATLEKLKEEMEKAYIKLVKYETLLDKMKKTIGYIMMEWDKEQHIYTYKDGVKFNYETQELIFPTDESSSTIQVYHISFGQKLFDEEINENFIHLNFSKRNAGEKYWMKRIVKDAGRKEITTADSIQIMEVFNRLTRKKIKAQLIVNAGGIISGGDGNYFRDKDAQVMAYNEDQPNNGVTIYGAEGENMINLNVTVFDDYMKPAGFDKYAAGFGQFKAKYPDANEIDFYSGLRAKQAAEQWVELLKALAPKWIKDASELKMVMGKLKKLKVKKIYFVDGKYQAKLSAEL